MGRIAEALRKAEEERTGASDAGVRTAPSGEPVSGDADSFAPPRTDGGPALTDSPVVPVATPPDPTDVRTSRWVGGVSPSLVALHGQNSILVEQYRALRTRLGTPGPRVRSRVLAITSSLSGEGKTVTTANLGVVLAEVKHHQVLLLDADFRHSSLAQVFGLPPQPGLADVLQGKTALDDVAQKTPVSNLSVIGAGATQGINPAELLSSKRAAAVFDDLRDQYSYVLVDTPPSSEVADAGIVGQLADAALIVIRMGRTPQPVVKRIIQTLQASQVNLLGCVLAGVEQSASPYGYYHDYVSRSLSES